LENIVFRKNILDIEPYIPGKPIEEVERELGLKNIVKLASNENPWGPSPKAVSAILNRVDNIHLYPDGSAYELIQVLSEQLSFSKENIILGNGSDELIRMIAETFLYPEDEVIIPEPTFSAYEFATKLMGGKIVKVPTEDYKLNLNGMLEKINKKTKLIFICNPNNPTGKIVSKEELEDFLNNIPEQIVVILDEAYNEYVESSDYKSGLEYLRHRKNLIVLRTFSKIYGLAGLRVGYGIADKQLIDLINRVREPFNVNLLAQVAAVASLRDKDYLNKCKQLNSLNKQMLYSNLKHLSLDYVPTEANFILIDLKRDAQVIYKEMLKKGVIIRPCTSFGLPNHIRVTIGKEEENLIFINALAQVLKK
jgi:histidinol-phosphate aminotransferase